jgi:mannose-6-phosphate isomerase-like protein (cupin superfamily)
MRGKVIRTTPTGWEGVEIQGYGPGAAVGVARHTIVGERKANATDPGPGTEVRYFEVQPGACTRLEKHEHEHYVIVQRGYGLVVLGESVSEIGPGDVIYVGPLELHQFLNRADEPFGFFCIVDACRDFVQEPSAEDLARLQTSPAGAFARPHAVPMPERA